LFKLRNAYNILVRKTEGKRPPRRHKQENNIKMDLNEIVCGLGSSGLG
jgi:hypothetical protein